MAERELAVELALEFKDCCSLTCFVSGDGCAGTKPSLCFVVPWPPSWALLVFVLEGLIVTKFLIESFSIFGEIRSSLTDSKMYKITNSYTCYSITILQFSQ